jgi:hypothetical protein
MQNTKTGDNFLQRVSDSLPPHLMMPPTSAIFYILNILLQILAFSLPPFRHRATIFVPLLIITAIYTFTPAGPQKPMIQYSIGSLWPLYISTIDRLLFSTPELECWMRGEKQGEAATLGFGLRKLRWSVKLVSDLRGVTWNFRARGTRASPYRSRWGYVFWNLIYLVQIIVLYDICHTVVVRKYHLGGNVYESTNSGGLGLEGFIKKGATAWVTWSGMRIIHTWTGVLVVAVGLYSPEVCQLLCRVGGSVVGTERG